MDDNALKTRVPRSMPAPSPAKRWCNRRCSPPRGRRKSASDAIASSSPPGSDVEHLITVYRMLAERNGYALHLGLTEAGMGSKGIVVSRRRPRRAAAGWDRRHDPYFADAGARAATAPSK